MPKSLKNKILRDSYLYCKNLAKFNNYKIQFIALNNFFSQQNRKGFHATRHLKSDICTNFDVKQQKFSLFIKDFAFKNDFMTPRQSILFTPKAYLYYTYQTFYLVNILVNNGVIDTSTNRDISFSTSHVHIYYAGILNFSIITDKNANYKKSYNQFRQNLKKFKGHKVIKLDIQDFFLGISISNLKKSLYKQGQKFKKNSDMYRTINNIINFLIYSEYTSLPQSQGSLASSLLSQIYLIDFTNDLENLCMMRDIEIVRYVDDMYLKMPKNIQKKNMNEIINYISSSLWKYNLSLNSKKVKVFEEDEFENTIQKENIAASDTNNDKLIISSQIINKVNELLDNDGKKLKEFWDKVEQLYSTDGNNMTRYNEIFIEYFSIDKEDANKVLNSLIFSNNWKGNLSINTIQYLLNFLSIITFDPEKYIILLLNFEKWLESKKIYIQISVKEFIGNFVKTGKNYYGYSIREGLMEVIYYSQTKNFVNNDRGINIANLSSNFREFLLHNRNIAIPIKNNFYPMNYVNLNKNKINFTFLTINRIKNL